MKNINQKLLSILFSLAFVLSATIFSFAENGDGSGGGQGNPVTIQSISINDGSTNVELKPYIVINFSKNVINMSVKENNKNCFSIKDESGNKISLNVVMADDQVEPEKKRIISLTPQNNLKEGKQYTLYISQNITSKSGDKLDSSRSISFKTKKAIEVSKEEDNDATKPSNTTNTNNNTTNSNNNTTSSTVKEEISKDNDKDKGNKDTEDKKDDNKKIDDEKTTDKEDKKNNSEKETEQKQESNNDIEKSSNNNVDLAVNNEQIKEEKKTNLVPIITVGSAVVVIGAYIYIKKVRK